MAKVTTITLSMPFGMGTVNSYLVETSMGHLLIDTGGSVARRDLLQKLEDNGCTPDSLRLVILTHGDFDHIGSAAYLRSAFRVKIAMHRDDCGMAERGDMFVNRKKPNSVIKFLLPIFSGFGKSEHFTPDVLVDDGFNLTEYGLEAKVISLPGHSRGSIGILTVEGGLFCGDLFENTKSPTLNSLMDDVTAAKASIDKLESMKISTIYPGHGPPFPWELLVNIKARKAG